MRFIEFMDVGTLNGWDMCQVVTAAEIVDLIGAEMPLEPIGANYVGEVAKRWRYTDGSGEIGIISSVASPSAATAPGPVCAPKAASSPACSPPTASTCGAPCETAPLTTS